VNPARDPAAIPKLSGDLVTSFFSCGFHYPVADYADLMAATVRSGGTVILDLRGRYLAQPDPGLKHLLDISTVTTLLDMPKSKRLAFRAQT
jgi:hypothetical protein